MEISQAFVLGACGAVLALCLRSLLLDRTSDQKDLAVRWIIERAPAGGIYATDICMISGVAYGAIYSRLARLEDAGIIEHRPDPSWPHRWRYFIKQHQGAPTDAA